MEKEKKILKLSVSRVKTYVDCPQKYYYSYIEKLPKKKWDHFDLGTLIHGSLETFHSIYKSDDDKPKLRTLMKDCFKKQVIIMNKGRSSLDPKIVREAQVLLLDYLEKIEKEGLGAEVLEIEKSFELKLSDKFKVRGYIDRIDRDADGVIHIKDYKTNKNMKYMEPFQLQVYGIPVFKMYPDVKQYRASYIMMRFKGLHISYDFNKEDVVKAKTKLLEQGQYILEEEVWRPKPSRLCDWCDFRSICVEFNRW